MIDGRAKVVSRAANLMTVLLDCLAVQYGSPEPHVLLRLNLKPSFSITLAVFQVLSIHMWYKAMCFGNTMSPFIMAALLP